LETELQHRKQRRAKEKKLRNMELLKSEPSIKQENIAINQPNNIITVINDNHLIMDINTNTNAHAHNNAHYNTNTHNNTHNNTYNNTHNNTHNSTHTNVNTNTRTNANLNINVDVGNLKLEDNDNARQHLSATNKEVAQMTVDDTIQPSSNFLLPKPSSNTVTQPVETEKQEKPSRHVRKRRKIKSEDILKKSAGIEKPTRKARKSRKRKMKTETDRGSIEKG